MSYVCSIEIFDISFFSLKRYSPFWLHRKTAEHDVIFAFYREDQAPFIGSRNFQDVSKSLQKKRSHNGRSRVGQLMMIYLELS